MASHPTQEKTHIPQHGRRNSGLTDSQPWLHTGTLTELLMPGPASEQVDQNLWRRAPKRFSSSSGTLAGPRFARPCHATWCSAPPPHLMPLSPRAPSHGHTGLRAASHLNSATSFLPLSKASYYYFSCLGCSFNVSVSGSFLRLESQLKWHPLRGLFLPTQSNGGTL